MAKTVAALYDDFDAAQSAVRDLVDNGFNRNDISMAVNNVSGDYDRYVHETDVNIVTDATMTGAGAGAVLGGLGGLAVSLGALLIPGVGPIIAAGPLLSALISTGVGAGIGALAGGLIGSLVDLGIPANEAEYYAEGIRRGGTLVTANVADEMVSRVKDILDRHHPVTLEERVNQWRESGWNHFDPDVDFETDEFDEPIRVRETQVNGMDFRPHYMSNYAGKGTYDEYAPAYRYGYDLARNPQYTNRGWLEVEPAARHDWQENYDSPWENFKDAVRHGWEEVKGTVGSVDDPDHHRRHYDTYLAHSGYSYDEYAPAYRYGSNLARNPQYTSRGWLEIEPAARRHWEENYTDSPWENFKDAVRHGWEEVKDAVGVR